MSINILYKYAHIQDSKINVTTNKISQSVFKCFKFCMKDSLKEKRMT